jgi:acetyl esterase/lipase
VSRPSARAASLLVAALLPLTACSSDDDRPTGAAPSTTESSRPSGASTEVVRLGPEEDLYALADQLEPGSPGDLIAVQAVDSDLSGTLLRVLYHSESLVGDDIAVSGMIAVPAGAAPADGRPVLSWAHGTTGIADECAPSKGAGAGALALAAPFLERDMVVVATDYEGLGTPGRHPYLVGQSEGRGVLDIARAARQLDDAGASDRVVVWGHSQGGHAALFASQIAGDWAPDLQVLGTVAGAPPSQLPLMADAIGRGPFGFFLAMAVAGWAAAYPEADPADVLTPLGLERLSLVDEGCTGALAAGWSQVPASELVRADAADPGVGPWRELFTANDPGQAAGEGPVLIIHGAADELIPVASSARLAQQLCGLGEHVDRRVYEGQGHASVVAASQADMLEWIDARVAGEPTAPTCPG